ncbi:DUF1905 domain-containing protein [Candidatus Uhrbacteria bacterium]|jgi:hypothetical protein|nr:DUF1905 domain-containing protein [Candidatus Uhrbacteria bacterium]
MTLNAFKTRAKLWVYPGKATWHFVTLNKAATKAVEKIKPVKRKGWGSIPINITVGSSTWKTSIFPGKNGEYIIPIKAAIRKKEGLEKDSTVNMYIEKDGFR